MNLEHHVTSLELSKRLKELGVPQESVFMYWDDGDHIMRLGQYNEPAPPSVVAPGVPFFSAFLASELGEMLVFATKNPTGQRWTQTIWCDRNGVWWHDRAPGCGEVACSGHPTEADARAILLIHLIEQGIVDPKTL